MAKAELKADQLIAKCVSRACAETVVDEQQEEWYKCLENH